jgi:hypothetical protein
MRKLAFVLLAAAAVSSCKKSENNNTGTPMMNAKVDGATVTFGTPVAEKSTSSGVEAIEISSAATGNAIELYVQKNGSVTTGTYGGSSNASILLNSGTSVFSSFPQQPVITITAIDATHVEGTFSGVLSEMGSGQGTRTITEGKFYAKF